MDFGDRFSLLFPVAVTSSVAGGEEVSGLAWYPAVASDWGWVWIMTGMPMA